MSQSALLIKLLLLCCYLSSAPLPLQALCMGRRPTSAAFLQATAVPLGALQQQHDATGSSRSPVAHG
jgi:hypothetical protein